MVHVCAAILEDAPAVSPLLGQLGYEVGLSEAPVRRVSRAQWARPVRGMFGVDPALLL